MSGHSKWAKIHRAKGAADRARGKVFQKLAKEIYVAAKLGVPDPDQNPSLRMIVEKARGANMPKDNIQKAIDKAKGAGDSENYESIRYEGYGPKGIAVIVDCLTDNKNRTAAEVRNAFTKRGGNLGTSGSVSYMFHRTGNIEIPKDYEEEEAMMISLDAGAEDFEILDNSYLITTKPEDFISVKDALEQNGIVDFLSSEVTFIPDNYIELSDEDKEKVYSMIEQLEDLDDVQDVYCNLKDE